MSDNRLQEPIYFQEELIERYANKRKALVQRDVKELLKCLVDFMGKNASDNYVFEIPRLAKIYNNTDVFDEKHRMYVERMGEYFLGNPVFRHSTLFKKQNKTKEELQKYQNELFEED